MSKSAKPAQSIPTPNLDAWCEGRPPLIRFLAKLAALAANDIVWGMNTVQDGRYHKMTNPKTMDPLDWIELYHRPRQITTAIVQAMDGGDSANVTQVLAIWDYLSRIAKMSKDHRQRYFTRPFRHAMDIPIPWDQLREQLNSVADTLINSVYNDTDPLRQHEIKAFKSPEMQFFIRVTVPALLLYNTLPDQMLESARKGDQKTLRRLIRLDKNVFHDPVIRHRMAEWEQSNPYRYRKVIAALDLPRYPKQREMHIKATLGAYLRNAAQLLNCPIASPDIHKLFDAAAKDRSQTNIIDTRTKSAETFRKAIARQRAKWLSFFAHWAGQKKA